MSNEGNEVEDVESVPQISSDFLTGSAQIGLDRIRNRLLDLTNRNRLLNFRHSRSLSLRIVGVSLDGVYKRLRDGDRLTFQAVPEPEWSLSGEPVEPVEYAASIGWITSYDLDSSLDEANSSVLPVLHFQEKLDTLGRKISSAANTIIEESGTNMLYLVFGFLEWYESGDSQVPRLAPLVTMPVSMERIPKPKGLVELVLEYSSGESLETNLSLAEKMRRDFGLEIPLWDDDEDTPGSYFDKFNQLLKLKKDWAIRRHLSLSLLSFGKLLMYMDLDPKTWPSNKSILKNPLVRELFEGTKNQAIARAEEYSIDEPEMRADVPYLIRDADSSQHSALIDALRGKNLVIEGPPGTGKSQTITNLIAAALAKGKSVLFVAEKLAALEVVRSRLDDADLGIFCLELHSHKTKKGALLADLAQRCNLRGTFKDSRDLDLNLQMVDEHKRHLTGYASLINKKIEPLNMTVFEILWARERYSQDPTIVGLDLKHVLLPVAVQYTPAQFAQGEQLIFTYSHHLRAVQSVDRPLSQHPWSWITKPLGFIEEERVAEALEELVDVVQEESELREQLREIQGYELPSTSDGVSSVIDALESLPHDVSEIDLRVLEAWRKPSFRGALSSFIDQLDQYRREMVSLANSSSAGTKLLVPDVADQLADAYSVLSNLGLGRCSVTEVKTLATSVSLSVQMLGEASIAYIAQMEIVGCNAPATIASIRLLTDTVKLIKIAPLELLHLRDPHFEADGISATFSGAHQEARVLQKIEAGLRERYDLSGAKNPENNQEWARYASTIESASFWQRIFGREYKQALKAYKSLALTRERPDRVEMCQAFRLLSEYAQKRAEFEQRPMYRLALGDQFHGVDSAWEELELLIRWYGEVFIHLAEHEIQSEPFRHAVLRSRVDRLKATKQRLTALEQQDFLEAMVLKLSEFSKAFTNHQGLKGAKSLDELNEALNEIAVNLNAAVSRFTGASLNDDVQVSDIPSLITAMRRASNSITAVKKEEEVQKVIGEAYQGIDTDAAKLRSTLEVAHAVTSEHVPGKLIEWLLSDTYTQRLHALRESLHTAFQRVQKLHKLASELNTLSASQAWDISGESNRKSIRARAESALTHRSELTSWNQFLRIRRTVEETGLNKVTALAELGKLESDHLPATFRFVFFNTLARSVFSEYGKLTEATGATQDQLRHLFALADKEVIRLYSRRVATLIDKREIPLGNQSGPVGTWTEMALITKEINKQKRHIPIRQLLKRSAKAMQALKPCFMMGPMSVAQYLAPGELSFDLVIMDEASQLRPEDAIGAFARGGQVVVVGDPKQLPPTNFFQRASFDSDESEQEDDRTLVEEGESILDVASTLFQPVRRLRWHYRSRHHSLIAFSNDEFYQKDLIIFPSAYHEEPSLGVKYQFIADAVYENSRNPREAEVVVDAALEHMRRHPNESLGIVALNSEQREMVEELLDHRMRLDPAAIAFQEKMQGGQNSLFIKNLENVQGDERDVIFISTTYGPDARGNQYQRFGPINAENGHRRLNVLFTRAKRRVVVFTSLDPDRIATTATSSWGLRALKKYLTFARTGILQQQDDGLDQPTNDFERSVEAVLKASGYEVVSQVGVAGFFIDLAVKHPSKPGTFLLGVECDGATYHSGRSARDRDRLRQEILENLGWKIHRVWSTDWFKNRDAAATRLLKQIADLLDKDPVQQRRKETEARTARLRQNLINLRESELKVKFPDTEEDACLLAPPIMDLLIEKRPRTKDEWFRKIPQALRTAADSRQVREHLDQILKLISDSE
jgi:very-short-patch-repair endonuclease